MPRILCSTGALIGRPNGRNYNLLQSLAQKLTCDGLELMIYPDWYNDMDAMLHAVQAAGLPVPVVHCEKKVGERITIGGEETAEAFRLFEWNCDAARRLGAEKLVLHLWDGIPSDGHFERNLAAYPRLCAAARARGLELLVENVVCNAANPMQRWCELYAAYPDVHFVFDTKMAAFHSQLELLYAPEYAWLWQAGHIRHYHLNDYGGGHMDWKNLRTLPIGRGKIDFDTAFAFIRYTGYEDTFTVESTAFDQSGAVDTDMLNAQFRLIREKLGSENHPNIYMEE